MIRPFRHFESLQFLSREDVKRRSLIPIGLGGYEYPKDS